MIAVDASVLAAALADDGDDGDYARRRLHGQRLAAPELIDRRGAERRVCHHRCPPVPHPRAALPGGSPDSSAHACFASFRVLAQDAGQLQALLKTLTDKGAQLAAGYRKDGGVDEPPRIAGAPPSDSGILGDAATPDSFTMTVGLAAGIFDNPVFGLAARKPRGLTGMKIFPDDSPDQDWLGGDLLLQLNADSLDSLHFALRDIVKATRGMLQLQWRIIGFRSTPRPAGASRNLFGYKDGIANPAEADNLVWIGPDSGQPGWCTGGTFVVIQFIRMLIEFWDRVGLMERDLMIGRHRANGAPLTGTNERDVPDYASDPNGGFIPLDAHIRLANPRTAATGKSRFLRRGYNYELGVDRNGNLQAGLIFACYQQNIQDQFEAVQGRLGGEPLTDYIEPFGGQYFIVLPGVATAGRHLGEALFN